MRFSAFDQAGQALCRRSYFSVGGGFVLSEDELKSAQDRTAPVEEVPFPFHHGVSMLDMDRSCGFLRLYAAAREGSLEARKNPRNCFGASSSGSIHASQEAPVCASFKIDCKGAIVH